MDRMADLYVLVNVRKKIDFQNFLKFWQIPPKCEDWR